MNKKSLSGKVAAIAVMLAMALSFVPFFGTGKVQAASHEITESYVGYYDQYHNGEHQMHYRAKMHRVDGQMAYCIAMTKPSEPGGAKEVNIKKFLPENELVMACLAQKHIFDMEGYTKAEKYMLTQCMVWYIQRDHIGDGGWRQYVSDINMSVSEQKAFFSDLEKKVKEEAPFYEGHGTAWENVDIADVQEVGVLLAPTLKTGDLTLKKVSAAREITEKNRCYSLSGAQYGIYTDDACTNLVHTMTTDETGSTEKLTLEAGSYYVKELKASKGYELDKEVHPVTIKFGDNKILELKEVPGNTSLEIRLEKIDKEAKKALMQGAASLEGAEFTVCYYDGFYTKDDLPDYDSFESAAKRKWVIKTITSEENGKIVYCADMSNDACKVGGDDYYQFGERNILPIGTLSIEETKAPEGYTLKGSILKNVKTKETAKEGVYVTQIAQNSEGIASLNGGNIFEVSNRVIRGDLSLRKIDEDTKKAMAGVEFKLTSKTTGESHTFVTDENGEYSTASKFNQHSNNTNGGKSGDGIWFGKLPDGTMAPLDDKEGALPYDTYELEEIKGENNEGMVMYKDTIKISRDETIVSINNVENYGISLQTRAKDKKTGTHYAKAENPVTVIDTVGYNNIKKDVMYRLVATAMDKATKKPLEDKEKNPVISQKTFFSKVRDGSVEMEISFDASEFTDKDIVIFEELYEINDEEDTGTLVAEHKDFESEEQTVHFSKPKTPQEEEPKSKRNQTPVKVTGSKIQSVKTGDGNSLIHLMLLLILSCAAIFTCGRIARKD